MIDVEDLVLARGGQTVLDGVSLSVAQGELVGVVGPNGAGKTTLLHAINGVLDPDRGTVRIDGQRVDELHAREVARLAATVRQGTNVGFEFTVEQIVEMGRTPYHERFAAGDRDGETSVARALDRTDTAQFADRPIGTISGGQRQRVLLARALAQDTPVLLLDEPTASLDVNHQVRTLELVEDVVAGGKTALAAIHDLDLAARFCDRLLLLSGGHILANGPPEDVLDAPRVSGAYDTRAAVGTDPITGTPTVRALQYETERDARVHVVGGGTEGAAALATLDDAGLQVTAGPLPRGDFAVETARARELEHVTAPAFAPLDTDTHRQVTEAIASADVTVAVDSAVAGTPITDLLGTASPLVVLAGDSGERDWPGAQDVVETVAELPPAVLAAERAARVRADD